MKRFPVVQVEWSDIKSDPNWQALSDMKDSKPVTCISVGYLVKVDRVGGRLILGHSITEDDNGDHTVIPLGVVKRIRRMKLSDKDLPESHWKTNS